MIGIPDPCPVKTSFTVEERFVNGEVYDIHREVDGNALQMSIDATHEDVVSVVCQMPEHEPEEALWTGVFFADAFGVPGGRMGSIRAMNSEIQTEPYRLGGLYEIVDL